MIDLSTWNITLPVSNPTVIETASLVGGYQDRYFQHLNGKLYFLAPVTGSTTQNSTYARSELRETLPNGKQHNWNYPTAYNHMRAGVTMTQVPSIGRVIIGQIHTKAGLQPMAKVEYQYKHDRSTGNVVAKIRTKPGAIEQVTILLKNVPLNQRFTYSMNLSPSGALSISANDILWSKQLNSSWAKQPLYFKAGVYVLDNQGPTTEVGAATFDKLEVEHRPL